MALDIFWARPPESYPGTPNGDRPRHPRRRAFGGRTDRAGLRRRRGLRTCVRERARWDGAGCPPGADAANAAARFGKGREPGLRQGSQDRFGGLGIGQLGKSGRQQGECFGVVEEHFKVVGGEARQAGCRSALGCAEGLGDLVGGEGKGEGRGKIRQVVRKRSQGVGGVAGQDRTRRPASPGFPVPRGAAVRVARARDRSPWHICRHARSRRPTAATSSEAGASGGGGRGPRRAWWAAVSKCSQFPAKNDATHCSSTWRPAPSGGWWNSSLGASKRRRQPRSRCCGVDRSEPILRSGKPFWLKPFWLKPLGRLFPVAPPMGFDPVLLGLRGATLHASCDGATITIPLATWLTLGGSVGPIPPGTPPAHQSAPPPTRSPTSPDFERSPSPTPPFLPPPLQLAGPAPLSGGLLPQLLPGGEAPPAPRRAAAQPAAPARRPRGAPPPPPPPHGFNDTEMPKSKTKADTDPKIAQNGPTWAQYGANVAQNVPTYPKWPKIGLIWSQLFPKK